jgi:hypothetical protein
VKARTTTIDTQSPRTISMTPAMDRRWDTSYVRHSIYGWSY